VDDRALPTNGAAYRARLARNYVFSSPFAPNKSDGIDMIARIKNTYSISIVAKSYPIKLY
jgi:hypothetical protein